VETVKTFQVLTTTLVNFQDPQVNRALKGHGFSRAGQTREMERL